MMSAGKQIFETKEHTHFISSIERVHDESGSYLRVRKGLENVYEHGWEKLIRIVQDTLDAKKKENVRRVKHADGLGFDVYGLSAEELIRPLAPIFFGRRDAEDAVLVLDSPFGDFFLSGIGVRANNQGVFYRVQPAESIIRDIFILPAEESGQHHILFQIRQSMSKPPPHGRRLHNLKEILSGYEPKDIMRSRFQGLQLLNVDATEVIRHLTSHTWLETTAMETIQERLIKSRYPAAGTSQNLMLF